MVAPTEEEAREAFIILNEGNGEMRMDALGTALRSLGWNPTEDEVQTATEGYRRAIGRDSNGRHQALFYEADADGNGFVDSEEFVAIVKSHSKAPSVTADQVREAFNTFDSDNAGYISTDEVRFMMKHLGEGLSDAEVEGLIKAVDADGNGKVDVNEFIALLG